MIAKFDDHVSQTLEEIKSQGLFKTERIITGPQDAAHPDRRRPARDQHLREQLSWPGRSSRAHRRGQRSARQHGFGMASVRFICGTQDIHKELEAALTKFLGTEDTILYPSCFDANGGLFETLLGAEGRGDHR